MALVITDAGRGASAASGASVLTGPSIDADAGDWLLAIVAADNAGAAGAASLAGVADSQGNAWTRRALINRDPGNANTGITLGVYTGAITNALANGTVTASFSPNTTAKVIHVYRVEPGSGEAVQFVAADAAGSAGSTTAHAAAAVTVANGDTIFGIAALESSDVVTGDSDATNGSWSPLASHVTNVGGGSDGNARAASQYKTVTATGSQSWACVTGGNRDSARSFLILRAVQTGASATAAIAEARDTVAAAGALAIRGSASNPGAVATLSATGRLARKATASLPEADDAASAKGGITLLATARMTASAAALAATAVLPAAGVVGVIAEAATLAAVGASASFGRAAVTLQGVTVSAAADTPAMYRRRGVVDERATLRRREREWERDLKRIIDEAWDIAHGLIDPVTRVSVAPPDVAGLAASLNLVRRQDDRKRIGTLMAQEARLREEDTIAVLLLAA
jgi:hypothetical protein